MLEKIKNEPDVKNFKRVLPGVKNQMELQKFRYTIPPWFCIHIAYMDCMMSKSKIIQYLQESNICQTL